MIRRTRIISLFIITISCLFIVIPSEQLIAQNSIGAKSIAMGQSGVALQFDRWAVFNNPAMLQTHDFSISFYGFRYVGISEITDIAAAGSFQTSMGTFGVGIHRYGFNLFSENQFRLVYKSKLDHFHFGASAGYYHILQGESYGSAGAVGFDLGLAAEIGSALWIGARATNVNQPVYGNSEEELPKEVAAGLSFKPSIRSQFTAEIVKDVKFPLSFRTGLEIELFDGFQTRAGISSNPSTYSFGFGYSVNSWDVNFALQQHNPLGLSPALDLTIKI